MSYAPTGNKKKKIWHYIQQDTAPHKDRCENLESYINIGIMNYIFFFYTPLGSRALELRRKVSESRMMKWYVYILKETMLDSYSQKKVFERILYLSKNAALNVGF
jgi:hypothetical protein